MHAFAAIRRHRVSNERVRDRWRFLSVRRLEREDTTMSAEEDALLTLCQCVNSLVNASLVPEHLNLAKYNAPDKSGTEALRSTLHILSRHAAREKRIDVDFQRYDTLSAVKLYLAFLQYPAIEFYGLSQDDNQNRLLLIALAWLLGTQDALTIALRTKLANSALGTEFSHADPSEPASLNVRNSQSLSATAQLDGILHLNGKVNQNLKEISELMRERGKLMCKVHVASIEYFRRRAAASSPEDAPHLSVSEMALIKRAATIDSTGSTVEDRRRLRELRDAGILLEAHAKWLDKRHLFFDWIATVMQEYKRSLISNVCRINSRELAVFISLLRQVIDDELRILTSGETSAADRARQVVLNCPSRAQKSDCGSTEAQSWLNELKMHQNIEGRNLQRQRERLAVELKAILRLIPSCVHV